MTAPITLGNLTVDRDRYEASIDGHRIDLTYVEFELLYALARNAGKALSRDRMIAAIWQENATDLTHRLTVHISRLRRKIEGSSPWRIETITKRGYILRLTARGDAPPFPGGRPLRAAGAHR